MNESGLEAHLFHPGLGNEVVEGKIFADDRAVYFKSEATSLAIPFSQLSIEWSDDDDRIFFRDKMFADLRIYADGETVLRDRHFQFVREQLQKSATQGEIVRRLKITGYFVAGCFVIGWLFVGATSLMVRALVADVPPEWEQKFGDEQIAELKGQLLEDSNRVSEIKSLAMPLLRVIPNGANFQFHIIKESFPNAFALPGGHIVLTTGLLNTASNDELLGVIAHESAHITQHHHARKIISAAGPVLIFGIFMHSRSGLMNLLGAASGMMVVQGFSQEYELEADAVGWKYLVAANVDPRGMISLFKKFKTEEAKEKMEGALPQAFQSHPALDKRIARLQKKWKKIYDLTNFLELETNDLRLPEK
ncbi:MAG TPA: M48 family metallopeptidase [Verrucomicrobiae bacterium]|nr:M48 family metallopeptidase [Verrucomicrobiae bacterium]